MGEFECGWNETEAVLKTKQQFYYLVFQDSNLKVTKILSDSNYDSLWARGTEEAKTNGGFWSIFNIFGKFVDGNVISK